MLDCFSKLDLETLASLEDQKVQNIGTKGVAALSFLGQAGVAKKSEVSLQPMLRLNRI